MAVRLTDCEASALASAMSPEPRPTEELPEEIRRRADELAISSVVARAWSKLYDADRRHIDQRVPEEGW